MNRSELGVHPKLVAAPPEPAAEAQPRLLFVPVDASPACQRAVRMAIRVAEASLAEIVLVGVFAAARSTPDSGPREVGALLTLSDMGLAAPVPMQVMDDEQQVARMLWDTLIPLQRHVCSSGIPVTIRLLRGDPAARLRESVAVAPRGCALALNNPLTLDGSLRELTGELLVQPPCTLYVTGLSCDGRSPRGRTITSMVRRLWHSFRG
jgi:nucleotide-binding universal stress UspA family protein